MDSNSYKSVHIALQSHAITLSKTRAVDRVLVFGNAKLHRIQTQDLLNTSLRAVYHPALLRVALFDPTDSLHPHVSTE